MTIFVSPTSGTFYTMQNVVDRARKPLNDADKERFTDVDLLSDANAAISILKLKRPDLFFGIYDALPNDKTLGDIFPMDNTIFPAVCDYVTARAETRNDESILEQRATLFFSLFQGQT
jgi:hypothetical protein